MNLGREKSGMNQVPPGNPAQAYDQYFVPAGLGKTEIHEESITASFPGA